MFAFSQVIRYNGVTVYTLFYSSPINRAGRLLKPFFEVNLDFVLQ